MSIANMIEDLKRILPAESFIMQPESAISLIKEFESKYKMETKTFLQQQDQVLDDNDREQWLGQIEIALDFSQNGENDWLIK